MADGVLAVDGGGNGGITVEGWNQDSIRVLAKVQAWSRDDDAEDRVREVSIETSGTVRANIPRSGRGRGASVSFRLMIPQASDLALEPSNGAIGITGVAGVIELRAKNGAISLDRVGGDVTGRTTNGAISVAFEGSEWDGQGLDVETTNGRAGYFLHPRVTMGSWLRRHHVRHAVRQVPRLQSSVWSDVEPLGPCYVPPRRTVHQELAQARPHRFRARRCSVRGRRSPARGAAGRERASASAGPRASTCRFGTTASPAR